MSHAVVTRHSTAEVTLPKGQDLLFPECCVACCGEAQTSRRHRSVKAGRILTAIGIATPGPAWWVPYCEACAAQTRRRLWLLRLGGFPIFFAGLLISIMLTRSMGVSGLLVTPIALVLAIALTFPVFMWGIAWRPAFDAMIGAREMQCRFRSHEYAREFEALNAYHADADQAPWP